MRGRALLILATVVLGVLVASGAALAKTIDGTKDDDLVGAENEDIIGGKDGADYISGAEGDDELYGGAGNDTVVGREGNDRISGDSGSDRLFGNEGTDTRTPGTVKRTLWSAAPESTQPTPIRTTRLTRPAKTSSCLSERPQLTSRRGA